VKKAHTLLRGETPTPVRYFATYYAPDGTWNAGMATQTPFGYRFVPEEGGAPIYPSHASLALGGNVALVEAQHATDGDSLGAKCAQPPLPAFPATQAWLARHASSQHDGESCATPPPRRRA
jgi:hypothetical protein